MIRSLRAQAAGQVLRSRWRRQGRVRRRGRRGGWGVTGAGMSRLVDADRLPFPGGTIAANNLKTRWGNSWPLDDSRSTEAESGTGCSSRRGGRRGAEGAKPPRNEPWPRLGSARSPREYMASPPVDGFMAATVNNPPTAATRGLREGQQAHLSGWTAAANRRTTAASELFEPREIASNSNSRPIPTSESGDRNNTARERPTALRPPAQQPDRPPTPSRSRPPRKPAGAKVIRTGDIEFEVESFDSALATVTKLVTGIKGAFVGTVNSDKLANGKVKGSIVVRVPPDSLDPLVLDLRKELGKGGELKGQRIGSQDITKQYTDLESRLKAARTMEQRLLQIIKEGKGEIKQLLEAEKELGVWRTKIEEFEGEIRYYANQVALSTLTITLAEKEIRAAAERGGERARVGRPRSRGRGQGACGRRWRRWPRRRGASPSRS